MGKFFPIIKTIFAVALIAVTLGLWRLYYANTRQAMAPDDTENTAISTKAAQENRHAQ